MSSLSSGLKKDSNGKKHADWNFETYNQSESYLIYKCPKIKGKIRSVQFTEAIMELENLNSWRPPMPKHECWMKPIYIIEFSEYLTVYAWLI